MRTSAINDSIAGLYRTPPIPSCFKKYVDPAAFANGFDDGDPANRGPEGWYDNFVDGRELQARRLLRLGVALVLAVSALTLGCGADSIETVEVVAVSGSIPIAPEVSPAPVSELRDVPGAKPRSAIPPSSAPEAQASQSPDAEAPVPGAEAPEGEQTTGGPGGGGGPGVEGPGGLVLYPDEEPGPFAQVTERAYDLCDESDALAAATGRRLGPGDEITYLDRLQIQMMATADEVDCLTPGGNRYSYVYEGGRFPARPTAAEARALHDATQVGYEDTVKVSPPGLLLGYDGTFSRQFPLVEQDEIVVLQDSILIRDGVVRGLVHNLSETQYAREVTVTARNSKPGSEDNGVVGTWRWPLTVQPGERAPFEIDGWTGPSNPAAVSLQVTATTSTQPDYKRAFGIGMMEFNPAEGRDWRRVVPPYARGDESIPDGIFSFVRVDGQLMLPDSHPEAAEEMAGIVIEDPRIFFALLDNDDRVLDVVERVTYASFDTGHMRIDRLPVWYDDPLHRDRLPVSWMMASILTVHAGSWQVWMGGANPPPTPQQTSQLTE